MHIYVYIYILIDMMNMINMIIRIMEYVQISFIQIISCHRFKLVYDQEANAPRVWEVAHRASNIKA